MRRSLRSAVRRITVASLTAVALSGALSPVPAQAADPFNLQQHIGSPLPNVYQFGSATALDGDTLAVLAYSQTNLPSEVWIYVRSGSQWTVQEGIPVPDYVSGGARGTVLALSGDTLAIADRDDTRTPGFQGSVLVYQRDAGRWALSATLRDPGGPAGSPQPFAATVALEDDTLVIGAPYGAPAGRAFVSTRTAGEWSAPQPLAFTGDPGSGGDFGTSVDVSGDTIVVGDPGYGGNGQGAIHVYGRAPSGWTEAARLAPPDGDYYPYLGYVVAISGDTIAAGVQNANYGNGGAYVYTRSGADWARTQVLNSATCCGFGVSLALDGDLMAVGAPYGGSGSIATFVRNGDQWTSLQTLLPFASGGGGNPPGGSGFGWSVGVSGDTVAGGSPWGGSDDPRGAEYVYTLAPADLRIAKLPAQQTIGTGGQVDQVLSVVNAGSTPAIGAVVTDALPAGFVLSGAEAPPGGSCAQPDAGTVRCSLDIIPAGGGVVIALRGTATVAGALTDTATVTAGFPADPDPSNNTASATVTAAGPAPASNNDLTITKTTDSATATVGDRVTYTLTIRNTGAGTTDQLVALDLFSAPVDVVSATIEGGTCTTVKPIVCRSGPLPGGATRTGTVVAVPQQPGLLRNAGVALGNAAVAPVQALSNLPNLTVTPVRVTRKISARLDVALTGHRTVRPGSTFAQKVRVSARGNVRKALACYQSEPGFRVTSAPGGLRLTPPVRAKIVVPRGLPARLATAPGRTVCWTIPSLPDGHSRTFTVHLRVIARRGTTVPTHAGALAANATIRRATRDVQIRQAARRTAPPAVTG